MSHTSKEDRVVFKTDTYEFYLDDLCITTNGLGYIDELDDEDAQNFDDMTDQLNADNNEELLEIILDIYSGIFKGKLLEGYTQAFQNDNQNVVIKVNNKDYIITIEIHTTIKEE